MAEEKIVHTVELDGPKPDIVCKLDTYKGKPTINVIYIGGSFVSNVKMGPGKAKMILHSIPEIKAFYDAHPLKD